MYQKYPPEKHTMTMLEREGQVKGVESEQPHEHSPLPSFGELSNAEINDLFRQLMRQPDEMREPLHACEDDISRLEALLKSEALTSEQVQLLSHISHLVTRSLDHAHRRAEALVEERTRELRNAYDDLKSQYEQLRQEALRDALTGLFNRRYLDETLEREIRQAQRHQQPVGMVVLDIDHFKQVNDTYGHDGGDAVLRALAQLLQIHIRSGDVVCRFGGEEFVIVLPGATLEDTRRRAEALLQHIRQMPLEHRNQSLGTITASAGVAAFPAHGKSGTALFRAADRALYCAKMGGRNRVVAALTEEQ